MIISAGKNVKQVKENHCRWGVHAYRRPGIEVESFNTGRRYRFRSLVGRVITTRS